MNENEKRLVAAIFSLEGVLARPDLSPAVREVLNRNVAMLSGLLTDLYPVRSEKALVF